MRNAILRAARIIRAAETERAAAGKAALGSYDEALHDRVEMAVEYLRSVKRTDDSYDEAVSRALAGYAEWLEGQG
jgi:hypothetical protein